MKIHPIILLTMIGYVAITYWFGTTQNPTRVHVELVVSGPIKTSTNVSGRVVNRRRVVLTALINGQVDSAPIDAGERVASGVILVGVDDREISISIRRALAQLERAREERNIYIARLDRMRAISSTGSISIEQIDAAEADVRIANAMLELANADIAALELQREKTRIRSPFDALVVNKSVEIGQWVEAGTPLVELADVHGWRIEAYMDASESHNITIGMPIQVTCDAIPGKSWNEIVEWVSPIVEHHDGKSKGFIVRSTLGRDAPYLLLNQQVELSIQTIYSEYSLQVPFDAVIDDVGQTFVMVAEANTARKVSVRTGIESFESIEITEGLKGGELIIRRPAGIANGQPIVPIVRDNT